MIVRDRDYIMDKSGVIFKVIGDVHPENHYLSYVKYYPHKHGDRVFRGKSYKHSTVVSKSFGILSNCPDYYIFSEVLGSVITGVPKKNVAEHFSAKNKLKELSNSPDLIGRTVPGTSLIKVIDTIRKNGMLDYFGITGSFLVGCENSRSDIDLVCYGKKGSDFAVKLFNDSAVIQSYAGLNQIELYKRRAKYMSGNNFKLLIKQEKRKLQGLIPENGVHINCEPLVENPSQSFFSDAVVKEIGEIELIAKIKNHQKGLMTPSCYEIEVETILDATIDDINKISTNITLLISYLGAYTRAFRKGDKIHANAKLVHIQKPGISQFGIELTPWTHGIKYSANLIS